MTTEEDLDLRAPSSTLEKENKSTARIIIFRVFGVIISLAAIVVCSYLLFNLFKNTNTVKLPLPDLIEQQETSLVTTEEQSSALKETTAKSITTATPNTAAKITQPPLPDLNNSDKEIRSAASQINPALRWVEWITTDEAIRKFVMVIDNLATGGISRKFLLIPKPKDKFSSTQDDTRKYMDKASFERYSPYISLFESIDNDMASAFYQRYSPLMEQAFSELGYTERNFHDTLMKAFEVLLSAPVLTEKIELIRPSVFFKYADLDLEQAPDAHKQMIRMGPENTTKLQAKIRQLQAVLSPNLGSTNQ